MQPQQQNSPNMGFGPLPGGYQNPVGRPSPQRKKLAIFFVVGVLFVMVIVLFSILGNRSDPAKESLVSLAIAQNELLRLAEVNEKRLNGSEIKRYQIELQLTETTSVKQVQAELKRVYKVKSINGKAQKAAIDTKTDTRLDSSAKLNRLDEDYAEVVAEKLAKQIETAQQAQGLTKNQQLKTVLGTVISKDTVLRNRFAAGKEATVQ